MNVSVFILLMLTNSPEAVLSKADQKKEKKERQYIYVCVCVLLFFCFVPDSVDSSIYINIFHSRLDGIKTITLETKDRTGRVIRLRITQPLDKRLLSKMSYCSVIFTTATLISTD